MRIRVVAIGMVTELLVAFVAPICSAAAQEPLSAAGREFFEKRVRPLLVEHCLECHGPEKHEGGLRLDLRDGWSHGGDTGPAIVPGSPDESLLIAAVRYESLEMPPAGRLPAEAIAVLTEWVARGAPDPRLGASAAGGVSAGTPLEEGRRHWSYQLPVRPRVPAVRRADWPAGQLDRFVLSRLEAAGLEPVPDADRAVLVRRLYYDLTGLPPTPDQLDAFLNDEHDDAYARLVDTLLCSPRFGERWGRHWLDVARYAESVTLRGFIFPQAWRYRDYVIGALNGDLPYDQFVREQIAGDLLPAVDLQHKQRHLIATTFLMLGNTNFEEQDKKQLEMDLIDEQLDTLGKAFLAQTIGCARCHDHKFDPIPTRDYYALAGILRGSTALEHANVSKWIELPLPLSEKEELAYAEQEGALTILEARLKSDQELAARLARNGSGATPPAAVVAAADLPGIVVDSDQAKQIGTWQLSQYAKPYIGNGYLHDQNRDKGAKTLTFHPQLPGSGRYEVRLAYTASDNRAPLVPITILHADGETVIEVNEREAPAIDGQFVSLGQYRFEQGNQGYVLVSNEGTQGYVIADAVQFLPVEMLERPAPAAHTGSSDPARSVADDIRRIQTQLKKLRDAVRQRPRVMTVRPSGKYEPLRIHIRGSVHNLGEEVPRGFLQVASYGTPPPIAPDECGRLQLAQWLTSHENPLTARVMVNRIWHWLFGAGIVRTTDNFGTTGETPTHPQLLDYLAIRFMDDGWSVKRLVRDMVLSRTYRLSTRDDERNRSVDPENRLLWRMNRRRLDAEAIRDTMLLASEQLLLIAGGPTIPPDLSSDYGYRHTFPCRSVFVPVFRNSLPELFDVFDFPDPSLVTGNRNTSTVATQALLLMNHPFVMDQAELTARRLLELPMPGDAERLEMAYRCLLGRRPGDPERDIAVKYLADGAAGGRTRDQRPAIWARLIQAIMASPDFRYVN